MRSLFINVKYNAKINITIFATVPHHIGAPSVFCCILCDDEGRDNMQTHIFMTKSK